MPLTTILDVFVCARHRVGKEQRGTQMALQNETVGMENSAIGNKCGGKMAQ